MPFYVSDYLADTSHLTTVEHGAYTLLIWAYWNGKRPLVAESARLAGIAKMTLSQWLKIEPTICAFFIHEDGLWKHKRIEAELKNTKEKLEQNSKAGKASAAVRWGKRYNETVTDEVTGVTTDDITECQPRASESVVVVSSKSSKKENSSMKEEFKEFWSIVWLKTGTGDAERAYIKQRKGGISAEQLKSAAIVQGPHLIQSAALRGSSVLHPATWLNQQRFLDEDFGKDMPAPRVNGKPPHQPPPIMPLDTRPLSEKFER
jgi:uncharacterized protein YdaU (DUF1376 family)